MQIRTVLGSWRKSRRSNPNGSCVELAPAYAVDNVVCIAVRDSKHPGLPAIGMTPAAWWRFTAKIKTGSYDL